MKKVLKVAGQFAIQLLICLSVLLTTLILWMLDTWRNITIDEIRYHLQAPKAGTDSAIITSCITQSIIPTLVITAIAIFVTLIWKKKKQIYGYVILAISLCAAVCAVMHVWRKLDVGAYLKNASTYSTFIDDNYVYPSSVEIRFPEKKRNLIYIFLESMETTFSDQESGGCFDENLIPNLTDLALENECFNGEDNRLNGAIVLNKATYTMGGIYAESMGLPLILPFGGNAMSNQDSFMPEIDGLGDILEKEGYQNSFLIGSEAVFGGRDLFYRDHGNYEILDYTYAMEQGMIPKNYKVFWGFEDAKLFEMAKEHLLEAADAEQPFNMTMLTVDTHFEDGYFCQDCVALHEGNSYADVYNCADRKVGEFVSWVQAQDFYENTTIVLVGDHLTMDSDFCKGIDASNGRKVYLSVIHGAAEPEMNEARQYSTLDLFPTTIAALGAEIEGNRLGLGTNLYSSEPTLLERFDEQEINLAFDQKSVMMEHLSATVDESKAEQIYESEWYYDAYKFAEEKGILIENASEFGPNDQMSRGIIVQTMYELEGKPKIQEHAGDELFSDIKGNRYEDAIHWACAGGIVADDRNTGKFDGNALVTREEIALLFYRYAVYKKLDTSQTGDLDALNNTDQVSEWALDAIQWAVGTELIGGLLNYDLAPQGIVTRAQAATLFMRFYETYGL